MGETEKHKQLKILGRTLLRNRGFDHVDIFEEHKITIGKKYFIVDICGIKENKKSVAVECGNTNPEKLINLKLYFDEVIHLPYGITGVKSDLRELIEDQAETIKNLKNEKKLLEYELNSVKNRLSRRDHDNEINNRIGVLIVALNKVADLRYYNYSKTDKAINEVMELLDKLYPQTLEE